MAALSSPDTRREALAGLRAALSAGHRDAAPEAFVTCEEGLVRSGLGELDAALGGGFPRGILATLEGAPGSGRSAVATRLLATGTAGGALAALVEKPAAPEGAFYPPGLEAAGVDLARLLVVPVRDALGVARAADIVLRAAAFGVVVIPAVVLAATAWTRLASLAHRANALVVAVGDASDELRYFASLRVRLQPAHVRWAGEAGLFNALGGAGIEATVLKHKRAVPGRRAAFACATFDGAGAPLPPLASLSVRTLSLDADRLRARTVV